MPDAPTAKSFHIATILPVRSPGFSRFFRLKAGLWTLPPRFRSTGRRRIMNGLRRTTWDVDNAEAFGAGGAR